MGEAKAVPFGELSIFVGGEISRRGSFELLHFSEDIDLLLPLNYNSVDGFSRAHVSRLAVSWAS